MSAHAEQYSHYRDVRARLWAPRNVQKKEPEAPAEVVVLRNYDDHVNTWRRWLAFIDSVKAMSTVTEIKIEIDKESSVAVPSLTVDGDVIFVKRSMKEICLDVLRQYPGVTLADLKGPRRNKRIVAARQECMYTIYTERKDSSFPMIGRFFGGRDHTTALHSINKIKASREKDQA